MFTVCQCAQAMGSLISQGRNCRHIRFELRTGLFQVFSWGDVGCLFNPLPAFFLQKAKEFDIVERQRNVNFKAIYSNQSYKYIISPLHVRDRLIYWPENSVP